MKKSLLIVLLLTAHLLKQLVWLAVIPIWHFPDEEQHFCQVSFYGDLNRFPKGSEFDVSQEIDRSSELLGTKRDDRGINKFTYNPEYRVPYIKGEIGLCEEEIKNLNNDENRQTMVKREAGRYGPVYYWLGALFYKLFNKEDLFARVFAVRLISVILSTLTALIVYLIAKELFSREIFRIALAFLVSFQPMFSFVSAGVNSDNLFNLIMTLILWLCLKIFPAGKKLIANKKEKFYCFLQIIALFTALLIGFYTKKQIFLSLPIIFLAYLLFLGRKNKLAKKQGLAVISAAVIFFLLLNKGKISIPEYNPLQESKLGETFFQYVFWHLRHTISETIPWYWGVFNWLGVVLPRWVNQIQARLLIAAALGIIVFLFKSVKEKKLWSIKNQRLFFLFGAALIYYAGIIFWDYFFRKTQGFSFGIQGRYFFPTIVSHMLFIIIGLLSLIPEKWHQLAVKILCGWWLALSVIGLNTAVRAYYETWSLTVFLNQISQYKPAIIKGFNLIGLFLTFVLATIIFMTGLIKTNERKNK